MKMRFGRLIVLACMGLAVACTSGTEGGTAGNTELNLDIVNPGGDTGAGFSIDRVDYRITCAGNAPGTYPIPAADTSGTDYDYDDSVDISGAFEVVDTRDPPVWQAVMDLPPGFCTITLSVYEDDEIVCVGSQNLAINEDGTTKYDIVLVCSLSIDTPDGMADVDGTFEFITGNLCPKLYVLNAIPSTAVQDTVTGLATSEIQYRAKDPDDTCGRNCDPQSCDFANPPVCTPYPSNINDPNCNPTAPGGDPNSAECQNGDYAGLVCTIAALPSATPGVPGGTFISPSDGTTQVGPVLPVNLNLASNIPGVILPGLGGPSGTNAANSPAYPPPLGNLNGSLPPLVYVCDITLPGPVFINLTCSDGDAECDTSKNIQVDCPGNNFCISDPIDCSGTNDCATDGLCDPNCDPLDPGCTNRCPGQDNPLPAGTPCSTGFNGTTGNVCLANGDCVECLADADCLPILPPIDCQLNPTCVANSCVAGGTAPNGTACSNGVCDGSGIGSSDPPCVFQEIDPPAVTKTVNIGCTNSITADISILDWDITADPSSILAGQPVTIALSGLGSFSEAFLDAGQALVDGGVQKAILGQLGATVYPRTGLLDNGNTDASLGVDLGRPSTSVVPYTCGQSVQAACSDDSSPCQTDADCTAPATCDPTGAGVQICDPANDVLTGPFAGGNTDCTQFATIPQPTDPCKQFVFLDTTALCDPALGGIKGICDTSPQTCDTNADCPAGETCLADCAGACDAGGLCESLTDAFADPADNKKNTQCDFFLTAPPANGFCNLGPVAIPTGSATGSYLAASGTCSVTATTTCTVAADCPASESCIVPDVLLGWDDANNGPGGAQVTIDGDGTWAMAEVKKAFADAPLPVGLRVNAGGLPVGVDCIQAVDSGGPDGVGVPDDASPSPDSALIPFNIQVPPI